ncbi:MAG: acyl-CoA dehydrogenase [Halieaceae bacterium]|jgi:butyryl-CoA dehydrogenase|uniref:acyl-CoA dehydrogenase n=1 Tax=Haliea alexandrii TaxID=2448162 RepID=UPI000F0BB117|nr:acyl-CoA dehydrogenase [Haliea alexandrii]MCR9185451.1 acyl-CoA dehydrogenase [Halieaceae bacterium]
MQVPLLNDRDIEFLLFRVFDTTEVLNRERYNEHTLETIRMTLQTAKSVAEKYFFNHYAKGDAQEPVFDGNTVTTVPETKQAWSAFADAGFFAATCDFAEGGMQLPYIVMRAANAYFYAANPGTAGYCLLCIAAADLLETFGTDEQKDRYLAHMRSGRFTGTMALTEPAQGSALQDISTRARPADDGTYRLFGQKMYISGGDHDLTENIIHMVLAKTVCPDTGKEGISLFICPKVQVNPDGTLGERNDVALAGLLHKMGFRNATSTVLNFGEQAGAVGYLLGDLNKGLAHMFQMMNDARIAVGLFATALGYQGYNYSLLYAKQRKQGRTSRLAKQQDRGAQVEIIEHADVRRMLLTQKAYAEASLAMTFYASVLFEDSRSAPAVADREAAAALLDLVTPVIKSWPSKYCLAANDLAIQVLGGAGYTRDHLVEQYYRDNRLNPIHEGTEGIQAIDLLGRKVGAEGGAVFRRLIETIEADLRRGLGDGHATVAEISAELQRAVTALAHVTDTLQPEIARERAAGLANATVYLDLFGRVFAAWMWLKQALAAAACLRDDDLSPAEADFYQGKLQAARFFAHWELPKYQHEAEILLQRYDEPLNMPAAWF